MFFLSQNCSYVLVYYFLSEMKEKLANIYREEKFIFLVLEIRLWIGMYSIIVMGFTGVHIFMAFCASVTQVFPD